MDKEESFLYGSFPEGFMWGVATSAYQIEGASREEGKSENIWDRFCHLGNNIKDKSTGDHACDSYHLYQKDIALVKSLGVNFYRFSISWCRIIPSPVNGGQVNQAGIEYYNKLIDGLLLAGVVPMITLYHFDLPQDIEDKGGFLNETLLVDCFKRFAEVCFKEFGDRVKYWITFNEPREICWLGYSIGLLAPGVQSPLTGVYEAGHNLLKAHASAWHLYDSTYRSSQKGKIFISINSEYYTAKEPNRDLDVEAAESAMQFNMGWFAHPIYINGDYPLIMKQKIALRSKQEGLAVSRLPEFTEEEKRFIKGTSDLFGLNFYTTKLAEAPDEKTLAVKGRDGDKMMKMSVQPDWKRAASLWLHVVPWGVRAILNWVKKQYNSPEILITENGFSDNTGTLEDEDRVCFFKNYINEVLKAVSVDGCNVIGYTAWSLLDNFEWVAGYTEKFGLVRVDFDSSQCDRTPKKSYYFYAEIIQNNGFLKSLL